MKPIAGNAIGKSRVKGRFLKHLAMSQLDLTPYERFIFRRSPEIEAVSQNRTNEIAEEDKEIPSFSDFPYESPGFTDYRGKIFIRENFPYVPRLTLGNLKYLPAYITERDVVPHEIKHAFDLLTKGRTSEPSAIAFEKSITGRTPKAPIGTLGEAFLKNLGLIGRRGPFQKHKFLLAGQELGEPFGEFDL